MAILNLQLIGFIIFLVVALEAQESPTESVATTAAKEATKASEATGSPEPTNVSTTTAGESSSSTVSTPASVSNPNTSTAPTQPSSTDQPTSDSSSVENGGYPFVKPEKHDSGPRRVKAHDGFHSLRKEKNWAHWNDAFTTPKP